MGDLNEPSRGVAQLCWFDETDHSDAGSRGLALLSQQLRVRVPRADCPGCVTCQKKKKKKKKSDNDVFYNDLASGTAGLF